mgnify:FL=1
MTNIGRLLLLIAFVLPNPLVADGQPGSGEVLTASRSFSPVTRMAFDHKGVVVTHSMRANGVKEAEHHGTLGHVTVARIGADGKLEVLCTSGEDTARTWLAGEDQSRGIDSLEAPQFKR